MEVYIEIDTISFINLNDYSIYIYSGLGSRLGSGSLSQSLSGDEGEAVVGVEPGRVDDVGPTGGGGGP